MSEYFLILRSEIHELLSSRSLLYLSNFPLRLNKPSTGIWNPLRPFFNTLIAHCKHTSYKWFELLQIRRLCIRPTITQNRCLILAIFDKLNKYGQYFLLSPSNKQVIAFLKTVLQILRISHTTHTLTAYNLASAL